MNKTAIKNFAIWARKKLISEITYKAEMVGINEKEILNPLPISTDNIQFFDIGTSKPKEITNEEIKQRKALVERIKEKESTSDYKTAFNYVIEEVAYTWFNRLIAIRFMEVNEYLPSLVRVLSSETEGKSEPDIVTNPFQTDIEFSPYEKDRIMQLKEENKLDGLFRMLFIKQCNKLKEILPELFEKTSDYTELLLNISFTDKDGIVNHLVNDIEEEDFKEAVEIIGWLYQYYNTELKSQVDKKVKKGKKVTKDEIPAKTQLFTPDWIVRYMVENSLGKLWIERHPNDELKTKWKYYLEEAEQEEEVKKELEKIRVEYKKIKPEDIKIIDPCMGSGHILVYSFDVLMQIYESQGYMKKDAAQAIVKNNLYGLDIDERAYQLSYFAIMMKGRKYDRRFLTRKIIPKIYSIKETNNIEKNYLKYFGSNLNKKEKNKAEKQMEYILDTFYDAKEYGSILNIDKCDWKLLREYIKDFGSDGQISYDYKKAEDSIEKLNKIIDIAEIMESKYDVVVTNPPYLGNFTDEILEYILPYYENYKYDLYSIVLQVWMKKLKKTGLISFVTSDSWMFINSYKNMRKQYISNHLFSSLLHFGDKAFEAGFGTVAFVIERIRSKNYRSVFIDLTKVDFSGEILNNNFKVNYKKNQYIVLQKNFFYLDDYRIAYRLPNNIFRLFSGEKIDDYSVSKSGVVTGKDSFFIRYWYEVNHKNINYFSTNHSHYCKYHLMKNGGGNNRYYGNNYYIIKLRALYNKENYNKSIRKGDKNFYFKKCISWSKVGNQYRRFTKTENSICGTASPSIYLNNDIYFKYILGFLNSKVAFRIINAFNPTMNLLSTDVSDLPIIIKLKNKKRIDDLTDSNINISKKDWDSFETSWDFIIHPFIEMKEDSRLIKDSFNNWKKFTKEQFDQLKKNEEELNRIFIDIYGLQDELTPEIKDKDITISKANLKRDIKSFISYAVGCMFGRYSLDLDGLAYAGGEWDDSKYKSFIPDKDNCIPITDEEYLEDDIVGRFVEFVKVVYGKVTLEENLDFIANAIGKKGDTSREIIRNYFIKDFFKDHKKTYQKRPIYWLYESGKQNGFKALIYMHRYTEDTTGIVRVDYLHKMQKIYMNEIDRMKDMIENSSNTREVAKSEKRKEKLIKQLKETKDYDEKIAHIALSRIGIDLDDGVKVNYEKVQTSKDGKKLNILEKI